MTSASSQATVDTLLNLTVLAFEGGENSRTGSLYPGQLTSPIHSGRRCPGAVSWRDTTPVVISAAASPEQIDAAVRVLDYQYSTEGILLDAYGRGSSQGDPRMAKFVIWMAHQSLMRAPLYYTLLHHIRCFYP